MGISLDGVEKVFSGIPAVDGVTVDIPSGEFFAVLGPSGCGKSTLLRLIAGLEALDQGTIALNGETVSGPGHHVPAEDRQVGFVFQSYALWPHMSVLDNVAFPIESHGVPRPTARQEAETHVATVKLDGLQDRKPGQLSGGQQQRVALARCLAGGASTILMDEPLANLDPHLRADMEGELRRFHTRAGATTLYITHDQREAMALADRVAVMKDGRFLQVAPPQELHDRPVSDTVAQFVGRGTVLPVWIEQTAGGTARARLADHCIDVACRTGTEPGAASLLLRSADFRIANDGEVGFIGTVTDGVYRGGAWDLSVSVPGIDADITVPCPHQIRTGERLPFDIRSGWIIPNQ